MSESKTGDGLDLQALWSNIEIMAVKNIERPGTLRAVMKIKVPALGIEISDVKVIQTDKYGTFVVPPDRKYKKHDGSVGAEKIVNFTDGMIRKCFREACLDAYYRQKVPSNAAYNRPVF